MFIDESSVRTTPVRMYARSPRGTRACGAVPCGHWTKLTALGALALDGSVGAMSIEAATSRAVFHAYLEQVLLPALRKAKPDAVIVIDNLSAHKTGAVRDPLQRSGFSPRCLPPYSPDLNPIEPAWAKIKGQLRKAAVRTQETLHAALSSALDAITAQDAQGFFRKAGYATV